MASRRMVLLDGNTGCRNLMNGYCRSNSMLLFRHNHRMQFMSSCHRKQFSMPFLLWRP